MNNYGTNVLALVLFLYLVSAGGCHWFDRTELRWSYDGVPHSLAFGGEKRK